MAIALESLLGLVRQLVLERPHIVTVCPARSQTSRVWPEKRQPAQTSNFRIVSENSLFHLQVQTADRSGPGHTAEASVTTP